MKNIIDVKSKINVQESKETVIPSGVLKKVVNPFEYQVKNYKKEGSTNYNKLYWRIYDNPSSFIFQSHHWIIKLKIWIKKSSDWKIS